MIRWRWFREPPQSCAYDRGMYVGWVVKLDGLWYASNCGLSADQLVGLRRRCDAKRLVELDVFGGSLRDPNFVHPRAIRQHPDRGVPVLRDFSWVVESYAASCTLLVMG